MKSKTKPKLFSKYFANDETRYKFQYIATYGMLGLVSLFMTIVNIITDKKILTFVTLIFAILSLLDSAFVFINKITYAIAKITFVIEIYALFSYFIISGEPEGFSAIWILMLPSLGLLLFGRKKGTYIALGMLIIIFFFYWIPFGRELLQYDYTKTFKTRFPFIYIAFYFIGLILEYVREITFENYKFAYMHDSLTNVFNRKGFMTYIQSNITNQSKVGFIMIDIDNFKRINDTYGHFAGDRVLEQTASIVQGCLNVPLCRWGGEEFAAIIPDGNISEEEVSKIVKIYQETCIVSDNKYIPVTISLGAVVITNPDNATIDYNILCKEADKNLYEAKQTGKNKAVYKEVSINDIQQNITKN